MTGSVMRIQIVMNIHAGTLRGGDPRQIAGQVVAAFADAGHEVSIEMAGRATIARKAGRCRAA